MNTVGFILVGMLRFLSDRFGSVVILCSCRCRTFGASDSLGGYAAAAAVYFLPHGLAGTLKDVPKVYRGIYKLISVILSQFNCCIRYRTSDLEDDRLLGLSHFHKTTIVTHIQ